MRASNAIYDVPEGRPIWKTLPIRLAVTVVVGVMLGGQRGDRGVHRRPGASASATPIGLGSTAVTVWNIAKWPVLVVLISLIFAILYWASPNAKHGGFRWVSPGGLFAMVLWLVASGRVRVLRGELRLLQQDLRHARRGDHLPGLAVDLQHRHPAGRRARRGVGARRAVAAGHPEDVEPYVQLRDDRKVKKGKDQTLG